MNILAESGDVGKVLTTWEALIRELPGDVDVSTVGSP
jgi:hypothetical protein